MAALCVASVIILVSACATVRGPLAPLCQTGPRGSGTDCKETSDGYLVPPSYYETLEQEEHTDGVPHASGETPKNPGDRQPATVAPAGLKANAEGTPTPER